MDMSENYGSDPYDGYSGGYYGPYDSNGIPYGNYYYGEYIEITKAAAVLSIIAGVLLASVAVIFFVHLWRTRNEYKRKGVKENVLTSFVCIHIPLIFASICEFVACLLRINTFDTLNVDVRKAEFVLRFVSLGFLELFLIFYFTHLVLLAIEVTKKGNGRPDEIASSSSLNKKYTTMVWQFAAVLYGQLLVLALLIVRLVTLSDNERNVAMSASSSAEDWLLFPEALLVVFVFVLLFFANRLSSPLKTEFEADSLKEGKEEPAGEIEGGDIEAAKNSLK